MMSDNLEWIDAETAVRELITEHLADTGLDAVAYLQADPKTGKLIGLPVALVNSVTENIGYIDRSDLVTVDIHAEGRTSKRLAELVASQLTGWNITTTAGYIDSIEVREGPIEAPLFDDEPDRSVVVLNVISRPKY